MKFNLGKMLLATVIMSAGLSAKADVCESTDGWKATMIAMDIAYTRMGGAGNTFVNVFDPENKKVLTFTATSYFEGERPQIGHTDHYQIESIFKDDLNLKGFHWVHSLITEEASYPDSCLRCAGSIGFTYLKSTIYIYSNDKAIKPIVITCK